LELQVEELEGEEGLPLVYDPETISAYWGKRPGSVATRIAQLAGVAGGFLSRIAWDIATKKIKEVVTCILCYDGYHQARKCCHKQENSLADRFCQSD